MTSRTTLLDAGWQVRREDTATPTPWTDVDLPHDAMIHEPRSAGAATGSHSAFFPGGLYRYRRSLAVPEDLGEDRLSLVFEGVYKNATVHVDGTERGGCAGGYTEFEVDLGPLTPGAQALIEVRVDNTVQPASRWYSGSGIYRHVHLRRSGPVRLTRGGAQLLTRDLGEDRGGAARTTARVEIDNPQGRLVTVVVALREPGEAGPVAESRVATTGGVVELDLTVPAAHPWSDTDPYLYALTVTLLDGAPDSADDVDDVDDVAGATVLDELTTRTGLRTLALDATRGLLVNGVETLLRGACVHHDSGVLGAATFRDAEHRRARILKEQGFNAVRSAHNPMSRDLLDACDEVGLYVMDELTDMWFRHKTPGDDASHFEQTLTADVEAMVRKDYLHPSVILYSIGNEVGESGTAAGIEAGRRVAAAVRALDASRPLTAGINLMINASSASGKDTIGEAMAESTQKAAAQADEKPRKDPMDSTAFNLLASRMGTLMSLAARSAKADRASDGVFSYLDVAGYNYAGSRYRRDGSLHPGRLIVGSETMPYQIVSNWQQVEELPYLIGDFMWTGWDHLGEVGIGLWTYGDAPGGFHKPFPFIRSGAGAIDLTGHGDGSMALARTVWTRSRTPEIAVRPLDRAGQKAHQAMWRGTDAVPSWSWPHAAPGTRARVEVYSYAPEVELLVGGRSLGTKAAGVRHGCVATFTVPYGEGDLTAVNKIGGREVGRATLRSTSGPLRLRVTSDREALAAGGQDLAHLEIEVVDAAGTLASVSGEEVGVRLEGADGAVLPGAVATLAALGSADPAPADRPLGEEGPHVQAAGPYDGDRTRLFQGRALAVVRAGREAGAVVAVVTSPYGEARVPLAVG
ncbi:MULTISPECIES: glycoside hydrolase family 2 TIM barrel-domain containing protein [unclassified Actinomyces]|uniref:glycoside hydrolase family 2 TIM barrel-domain containing protein n=1 Tax=unclassified Actinomyces TaxID=2609248 RepID=UPI0020170115|nr:MULTISPECIES: glycoside hydrolase family 2 TIM barrel-domain containing protein [unclassified Actinomyces]MCL3777398.1 DUF4982 domain-containing protein [Actinomyces sp. AC-20-1]MCL3789080.1 DUF4982 domain-containing protein [Actinomyces sp. 187325]MCL3791653.1 DUF4982 domain-containing protein [Actinomyces sp. 186855]MCL3793881.1 DUF4982 domain-containing protein [Actinomyces sp. 217892]